MISSIKYYYSHLIHGCIRVNDVKETQNTHSDLASLLLRTVHLQFTLTEGQKSHDTGPLTWLYNE
jgi:hypothetical protein